MSEPKYEVGDRIQGTLFVIRGVTKLKNGNYRYFVQVGQGDNTFVANIQELENAIKLVRNAVIKF